MNLRCGNVWELSSRESGCNCFVQGEGLLRSLHRFRCCELNFFKLKRNPFSSSKFDFRTHE